MVCPPAGPWAGEDLAQVRGCCGSSTHKPHTQQRGQQQSSWPACQRLWRQRSSSPKASSPNANFLLRCGWFSPLTKAGHGEEPWCGCIFAPVSQDPSVQAQLTRDEPPGQGGGCPCAAPQAMPQERGDVGLQTKPGSCCGSGISGEGMISTTINTSDYLIRGMRRSPGGGLHTQKRSNSCPH